MKNIFYLISGVALLAMASCMDVDNWAEPDCRIHGRLIDAYTGENFLADQNDWKIRIWERSYTATTPTQQELNIKQDGTYNNSKLFAGTYDMLPYNGPFWPIKDTIKNVVLNGTTEQDFILTPYLQIIDLDVIQTREKYGSVADRPHLTFTFKMKAPVRQKDGTNLPNLREARAFLSLEPFCGAVNYINVTEYNPNTANPKQGKLSFNKNWVDACKSLDDTWVDSDTSPEIVLGPMPVNNGYTYNVRVGVSCDVGGQKFNYSPIINIAIPK